MQRRDFARLSTLALGGLLVPGPRLAAAPRTSATSLRVMSFNIRYGSAADGPNHWDLRKAFLTEVLAAQRPDIIGIQEALRPQLDYIVAALPGYAMVGVGRDDGVNQGEFACILYRWDALALSRSDTFWFSDTPERVASTGWGNRITRICTWAQFVDREHRAFVVFNVHLDHESQPSRERSVALLRARIAAHEPKLPVIVTGDFNAGESNPAVIAVQEGGMLRDTFRDRHPAASPVGTFTAFARGQIAGEKIDYVFASPEWEVLDAAILRDERDGRYPSDHFPVTAVLRMRGLR